jgi:hypothetical protein
MKAATARTAAPLPVWSGRSKPRNWLFVGLVLSLALHGLLCFFFYRTGFQPTAPLGIEKRPPPTFKVKNVDLAPKPLDQATAQPLAGTDGATFPFWSPDSRSLAFFADSKLKRIDLPDGPAVPICDAPSGPFTRGTWGKDGVILIDDGNGKAIYSVLVRSGAVHEILPANPSKGEVRVNWPWFLPDGKHFLYLTVLPAPTSERLSRLGPAGDGGQGERVRGFGAENHPEAVEDRLGRGTEGEGAVHRSERAPRVGDLAFDRN